MVLDHLHAECGLDLIFLASQPSNAITIGFERYR